MDGGGALTAITIANSAVTGTNTIIIALEWETGQALAQQPYGINQAGRSAGVSFEIECDFQGAPGASVFTNYMIFS